MVNMKGSYLVNSNILSGEVILTDTNPLQLVSNNTPCTSVTLKADFDNTNYSNYVLIGNDTTQNLKLLASESITLDINDLSKIYLRRVGSENLKVQYIGGAL